MTATGMPPLTRAARKRRLLHIIAGATEQLLAIEVAEYRAARLRATIVEPAAHELDNPLATRTQRIRAWATANGHPVKTAGRLPAHVITAYTAAHPDDLEATP